MHQNPDAGCSGVMNYCLPLLVRWPVRILDFITSSLFSSTLHLSFHFLPFLQAQSHHHSDDIYAKMPPKRARTPSVRKAAPPGELPSPGQAVEKVERAAEKVKGSLKAQAQPAAHGYEFGGP